MATSVSSGNTPAPVPPRAVGEGQSNHQQTSKTSRVAQACFGLFTIPRKLWQGLKRIVKVIDSMLPNLYEVESLQAKQSIEQALRAAPLHEREALGKNVYLLIKKDICYSEQIIEIIQMLVSIPEDERDLVTELSLKVIQNEREARPKILIVKAVIAVQERDREDVVEAALEQITPAMDYEDKIRTIQVINADLDATRNAVIGIPPDSGPEGTFSTGGAFYLSLELSSIVSFHPFLLLSLVLIGSQISSSGRLESIQKPSSKVKAFFQEGLEKYR